MKVKTIDGTMYDIDMAEAERIHREMSHRRPNTPVETNEEYQKRAYLNVCERASFHGVSHVSDNEQDMKEALLLGFMEHDADLVGEVLEWFIAEHAKKVGA